jgi:multimeric flavodoxin WrbA
MKIVIINASFRKSGATAKILNEFCDHLKLFKNVDIAIFHLSDLNINYCQGCCGCYKTGQCFLKDDANMLIQAIVEADGLVLGTPNYVSNVSGQLKTFIDRAHFVLPQLLKDKHTVGVVTYENVRGGSVFGVLKNLFILSGAKTTNKIIIKTSLNTNPLANEKVKTNVKDKAAKFYNSILMKKSSSPLNRIVHFCAFNLVIKPFVLKKGQEYQGVQQHWSDRGISY